MDTFRRIYEACLNLKEGEGDDQRDTCNRV